MLNYACLLHYCAVYYSYESYACSHLSYVMPSHQHYGNPVKYACTYTITIHLAETHGEGHGCD